MFTPQFILDKILKSDVWMLRSFNKLISEKMILDDDILWFSEIKKHIDSSNEIPPIVKQIIRKKLTTIYLNDIVDFANNS